MKTFASKENSTTDQLKGKQNQTLTKQNISVNRLNVPIIQRKTVCPCDGGCPSCNGIIQAKLKIGQPNDKYEQEADRVADQVMRMPEPDTSNVKGEMLNVKSNTNLQKQPQDSCPECEEDDEKIHAKPISDQITPLIQRDVAEDEEDIPEEEVPEELGEEEESVQTKQYTGDQPSIQRKEAPELEEEEEEPLQTKANPGKTRIVAPGLQRRIDSLKGDGRPLSKTERNFFEPRFGTDFSDVRIHTDRGATNTAASINAKAFTIGENIVFNSGQYHTESSAGKRLLGHELTHVVQQTKKNKHLNIASRSMIQRSTPGPYTIEGLYEGSELKQEKEDEKNYIFFDWDKPSQRDLSADKGIDPSQEYKITRKQSLIDREQEAAKTTGQPFWVTLYGFASEEGASWYNKKLIERRMTAVEKALQKGIKPYTGLFKRDNKLGASKKKSDYRYWRTVEMRVKDEDSTRPDVEAGRSKPKKCDSNKRKTINAMGKKALAMLTKTISRLNNYISNPANDPGVKSALYNHIGRDTSANNARRTLYRMNAIKIFIHNDLPKDAIKKGDKGAACYYDKKGACRSAIGYGGGGSIELCPVFFYHTAPKQFKGYRSWDQVRVLTLIHETGHAGVCEANDLAYSRDRMYHLLTATQALNNAESLENFVKEIDEGSTGTSHLKKPDQIENCGASEDKIKYAAAWAQRWNTHAYAGITVIYGDEKPGGWGNYMRGWVLYRFHRNDWPAIAGMNDRYLRMDKHFRRKFYIRCLASEDQKCQRGAKVIWTPEEKDTEKKERIEVCPAFAKIRKEKARTIAFYSALVRWMPRVTRRQWRAYPLLAKDFMDKYWGPKPNKKNLLDTLNEKDYRTGEYDKAVKKWRKKYKNKPIEPYLTSTWAKTNYANYKTSHP